VQKLPSYIVSPLWLQKYFVEEAKNLHSSKFFLSTIAISHFEGIDVPLLNALLGVSNLSRFLKLYSLNCKLKQEQRVIKANT
jgi:hypothetical protein